MPLNYQKMHEFGVLLSFSLNGVVVPIFQHYSDLKNNKITIRVPFIYFFDFGGKGKWFGEMRLSP
jgi:hypothetical protein